MFRSQLCIHFFAFKYISFHFAALNSETVSLQSEHSKVFRIIEAYRQHGHLSANVNPISERRDWLVLSSGIVFM